MKHFFSLARALKSIKPFHFSGWILNAAILKWLAEDIFAHF